MLKNSITQFMIPFIEKAILSGKYKTLVGLALSVSPSLKKEIMDRLSKDRVKR